MFREKKFVKLGLSNFTAYEVAEVVMICRQHGWVRPSIYQGMLRDEVTTWVPLTETTGMYNAITRNLDAELFVACRRYGIDIVVYNPIAGGLFSGKYTAESLAQTPESGRFSDTAGSG